MLKHSAGIVAWLCVVSVNAAIAQTPGGAITSNTLLSMPPESLLSLYRQSPPACIPRGPIRGVTLTRSGTPLARPLSLGGRAVWQGKIFQPDGTAINRFFGAPVIAGRLYHGASWHDSQPALILDYEHTSKVYWKYRDEIRQVAPGLYLGLMYDRTTCPPTFVRFFALER